MTSNDKETKIYKTVFSTCNKKDKNCRGWRRKAKYLLTNKIKKLFEYEKSWLKVFDKSFICHILIILIHQLKENRFLPHFIKVQVI